jgi:hypothetical protein
MPKVSGFRSFVESRVEFRSNYPSFAGSEVGD